MRSFIACLVMVSTVLAGETASVWSAAAETSRAAGALATLVRVDGKVMLETYANGEAADRAMELASGAKSFTGILALCAVEDRLLTLDELAADTLGEWRGDPRRGRITVRQLLTLTSGIPGGESLLRGGRMPTYAEAIAEPAVANPGTTFSYGPRPFQVFGEILRRKLAPKNETVAAYLERRVLKPLGIVPGRWRTTAPGQPNLPSGAALTARDWAKLGEFIRQDGSGVLPPGKLKACFEGTDVNPGYGLSWWLPGRGAFGAVFRRELRIENAPRDVFMAAGAGGQRLVVVPSLKLVAVRLAPVRAERQRAFDDAKWIGELVAAARSLQQDPAAPSVLR